MRTRSILLVAVAAGILGIVAGLAVNGPGPLLRTELGQRAVQQAMDAVAPAPPEGLAMAKRGGPIPVITLPDLAGAPRTLPGDFGGRPLLVNLWASWWGALHREMPELDRFAAAQGERASRDRIGSDDQAAVEDFLARIPVRYTSWSTPAGAGCGVQPEPPRGAALHGAGLGRRTPAETAHRPFVHGELDDWARIED